jgi:AcrR family transcriptional regulator
VQCYTERNMELVAPPTRRDRKKLATRRALQWAALGLVADRGYANVTVEEIAEAADVSARTFFNYFPSKEAAVIGHDPDLFDTLHDAVIERPAGESAFEAVRAVVRVRSERFAQEADGVTGDPGEWFRRMKTVQTDPHLRAAHAAHTAAYERVIVTAVAERLGTDPEIDPYPALLAAAAVAASRIAVVYWAKGGGVGTPAPLTDAAFVALAGGLAADGQLAAALAGLRGTDPQAGRSQNRKEACS